jgi:hypothetical protein
MAAAMWRSFSRIAYKPDKIPFAAARLPGLAKMRNVGEHIDDYVIEDGRAKDVQRGDLQVILGMPPFLIGLGLN